jgi:hypothetical protein
MTRCTIFMLAMVIVACGEAKRDEVLRGASDSAASPDSLLRGEPGDTDMRPAASAETTGGKGADTAARPGADAAPTTGAASAPRTRPSTGAARAEDAAGVSSGAGPTGAEAMGGIRASRTPAPRDLSAAQVRRLQAALNILGCNAGAPDGVLGQTTRQAITCGLKKKNLGPNDYSGLYRSLSLNF